MYTKEQVDEMLSQVEQELEKSLGSITKNEEIESESEEVSEDLNKNEVEMDYTEEDYQTISEIYSEMDKSEKEAHYKAIRGTLFGEEEVVAKSETVEEPATEEVKEEESLNKAEVEAAKAENEELKKNMEAMTEVVNQLLAYKKAPSQKAITGASYIAKSEETAEEGDKIEDMSKNEITSQLKKLDFGSLSKSERTSINEYYLNNGSVEEIKHLIKK